MRRVALALVVVLSLAVGGHAAEQIDLATPETKPANTRYTVERLTIDVKAGIIYVQVLGANGEAKSAVYNDSTTPTGRALIAALNTANLSVKSLQRRILERLVADGVLTGTVSGTPD